MPNVPVKFQTAKQKARNQGNTNIPWKFMTAKQKSFSRNGKGGGRRTYKRRGSYNRY